MTQDSVLPLGHAETGIARTYEQLEFVNADAVCVHARCLINFVNPEINSPRPVARCVIIQRLYKTTFRLLPRFVPSVITY